MPHFLKPVSGGRFFVSGRHDELDARMPSIGDRIKVTREFKDGRRRLSPEEAPHEFILNRRVKTLPDMFKTLNGALIFSARAVELFQSLEPDANQFLPVDVRWANGDTAMEGAALGIIMQRRDTIVPEKSDMQPSGFEAEMGLPYLQLTITTKLITIRTGRVEGAHLWREHRNYNCLFISDEAHAAIKAQKFVFPTTVKAKEI